MSIGEAAIYDIALSASQEAAEVRKEKDKEPEEAEAEGGAPGSVGDLVKAVHELVSEIRADRRSKE